MYNKKKLIFFLSIFLLISCDRKIKKTEIVERWPNNNQKTVHEYFNINDSSFRKTEYYESGRLKSKYYYQEGEIEGPAIGFFENGDTAQISYFKKGIKDGLEKTWYETGALWSAYIFEKGKKISGNHFFRNGQPTAKLKFEEGYVTWGEYYHPNGNIRSTGAVDKNKKVGVWEYYHENGNLKEMGEYVDGKKIGVWQEFDEEGNLIHDIYF